MSEALDILLQLLFVVFALGVTALVFSMLFLVIKASRI